MSDPMRLVAAEELSAADHTHHWLISEQNGPSSEATCKGCGEQREFMNSLVRKQSWIYRSSGPPGQKEAQ